MKNQSKPNRPTHNVFVVEGEGDKAYWTKVGVAWQHSDGEGMNITLSAIPLTGRIVVRSPKSEEETNGKAER
jgi:hypothetical protein